MDRSIDFKDIEDAFASYQADPTPANKSEVLRRFHPVASLMARRKWKCLRHPVVDWNDLANAAVFGVVKAIDQFDEAMGKKFTSYAVSLASYAMLDHLREVDHVPRLERIREKKGMVTVRSVVSLSDIVRRGESREEDRASFIAVPGEPVSDFDNLCKGLDRTEKMILSCYYQSGLTMREIGIAIGFSECRISQIHKSVIERLRAQHRRREREERFRLLVNHNKRLAS